MSIDAVFEHFDVFCVLFGMFPHLWGMLPRDLTVQDFAHVTRLELCFETLASCRLFRSPKNSFVVSLSLKTDFGQKHDFAVHFEHNAVRRKRTSPRKFHIRKYLPYFGIILFFDF